MYRITNPESRVVVDEEKWSGDECFGNCLESCDCQSSYSDGNPTEDKLVGDNSGVPWSYTDNHKYTPVPVFETQDLADVIKTQLEQEGIDLTKNILYFVKNERTPMLTFVEQESGCRMFGNQKGDWIGLIGQPQDRF